MSLNHVGNVQPSIDKEEHWHAGGDENNPAGKKVIILDANGDQVTSFGADVSALATATKQDDIITELETLNSLVPSAYDYIALTYVSAGNGAGEIETAVFKTGGAGGDTVATLTLTYNASNEVATVTKT
jgi:hypothetical protein